MERLIIAKRVSDFHTSALIQAAIYHFCRRRLLDRHMERMQAGVQRLSSVIEAALESGRRLRSVERQEGPPLV